MFKLQPDPTFTATVMIPQPGGDPLGLDLEFRHMGRAAFMELATEAQGGRLSDLDAALRLVVGWQNMDAEFSPENLAKLLDNYIPAADAIVQAYRLALMRGRQKN